MRLLLTPVYIASVYLSLVNGAEFLDVSDDEQGFGMERSDTTVSFEGSSADSSVQSGAKVVGGDMDYVKHHEEARRKERELLEQRKINIGWILGYSKFPFRNTGCVLPTIPSGDRLLQEASQNCLAPVRFEDGKVVLAIPALSKPGVPNVSTAAATPRPSYMKRTTSLQDALVDAL